MNHRELDRLLCERLGIEPKAWSVDSDEYGEHEVAVRIQQRYGGTILPCYPALSTTGDGMVRLMDALAPSYAVHVMNYPENHHYRKQFEAFVTPWASLNCYAKEDASAPLALALAAAAALGIEVPDPSST